MKDKGVITNTVCIVTAIVCVVLTFWGNLKNDGVLSTDAYMGVIATLIGICATIVVGFQIVSFMEFRNFREQIRDLADQQQKMEMLRQKLEEDNDKLQKRIHMAQAGLANAFIITTQYNESERKGMLKIVSYCFSIACEDLETDYDHGATLNRYKTLYELITEQSPAELIAIKEYIDIIRNVQIPDNWPEHNAIMKIHYDIIYIIDNLKNEPAAETEQK